MYADDERWIERHDGSRFDYWYEENTEIRVQFYGIHSANRLRYTRSARAGNLYSSRYTTAVTFRPVDRETAKLL